MGSAQMGSALMSTTLSKTNYMLLTNIFGGTPVYLLLSSQKCQGIPFFPNRSTICTFAAAPLVSTPFVRNRGTHLVVATPGRLLDFLQHGAFSLSRVSFLVLDEGDRLSGFATALSQPTSRVAIIMLLIIATTIMLMTIALLLNDTTATTSGAACY